jgi:hypothetical protein
VRFPWMKRSPQPTAREIGARCPGCRCELPVTFEQAMRLADIHVSLLPRKYPSGIDLSSSLVVCF